MENRKLNADAKGFITKSSSAAIRSRRRFGNTSTCPYVHLLKRTYGHVLVLPSQRLVHTTAKDDFVKGFIQHLNPQHQERVTNITHFKYQQIESKEDFNIPIVSSLVKISELNECDVGTRNFSSVKTKLTFGDVQIKMVQTRYGKDVEVKDDCVLENESGNITFHIWDDICKGLKNNASYYFENLQLKKFKGEKFLASTAKTSKTELETHIELPATTTIDKKAVEIPINRFDYVEKIEFYYLYRKYKLPIVINSEKAFLECWNCRAFQRSADLHYSGKCNCDSLVLLEKRCQHLHP